MSGLLRFSHNWQWKSQIFPFPQNFSRNWNAGQVLGECAEIHTTQTSSASQHSIAPKGRACGTRPPSPACSRMKHGGCQTSCPHLPPLPYLCDTVKPSLPAWSSATLIESLLWLPLVTFKLRAGKGEGYQRLRDRIDFGESWADKTGCIH